MEKKESEGIKVYAFMSTQHEVTIVVENGRRVKKLDVESEQAAKQTLMSDILNQQITISLGSPDFNLIWVKDPAGDPAVLEACKKMEELDSKKGNALPAVTETDSTEETVEEVDEPEPEEFTVNTLKTTFKVKNDDGFSEIPGHLLNTGDICQYFNDANPEDGKLYTVVSSPEKVTEFGEEEEWIVKLISHTEQTEEETTEKQTEEVPPDGPQFPATGTLKKIEVECEATPSEEHIRGLVLRLQQIKGESLASAASYREDIKAAEKNLFEACNGKSYTMMECVVENDWEGGVRKYRNPKTNVVVKEEKIPFEEQQLNMNTDLGVNEENTDVTDEEQEKIDSETAVETGELDESGEPAGEEAAENTEDDDFPPPEENGDNEGVTEGY